MKRSRVFLLLLCVALGLLVGCSRDPNVRKQKYLESGNRYFQQGKYREAAVQYQNALQVRGSSPSRAADLNGGGLRYLATAGT